MIPLFAPKPPPRGVRFGPGYADHLLARQGAHAQTAYAPWRQPHGPAAAMGWAPQVAPPMTAWPTQAFHGLGFGGLDPFSQQQVWSQAFGHPSMPAFR